MMSSGGGVKTKPCVKKRKNALRDVDSSKSANESHELPPTKNTEALK